MSFFDKMHLDVTKCCPISSDVGLIFTSCDPKKALLVIQQETEIPQKSIVEFKLFVNHFKIAISQPWSRLRLGLFKMLIL